MMNTKLSKNFEIKWQHFFAFAMLGFLAFYLIQLIAPLRWKDLFNVYGVVGISAFAAFYFSKQGLKAQLEVKLFGIYVLWVFISRILNKDIYLFVDFRLVINMFLMFLLLASGALLDKRERGIFLDVLSLIYLGFFFVVSLAAVFVFLTNTYIHVPPENVWITVITEGNLKSLNILSTVRLAAVIRLLMAISLAVYQFIKRKNLFVRIILGFVIVVLHFAIALCHGRTTQIAMSVGFAMLMMLLFIPLFEKKHFVLRVLMTAVIALASLIACYKSFDAASIVLSKAEASISPAFEAYYESLDNKLNSEYFGLALSAEELKALSAAEDEEILPESEAIPEKESSAAVASAVDGRSLKGNWTFTGRTEIWHAGLLAVKEDIGIALRGRLTNNYTDDVNRILQTQVNPTAKEYKSHMHNSFMQVLMIYGVPGLLLILAWTVIMVKNMLKIFFAVKPGLGLEEKFLTAPIAAMFIVSLGEPIVFCSFDTPAMVFYLISGAFISIYYDYFSNKN